MPGIAGQAHFASLLQRQNIRWMDDAACQNHPDLDWFDLDCGLQEAARVCYSCPVMKRCLDYAVAIDVREGIWGGLWGDQLAAYQRRRVRSRR